MKSSISQRSRSSQDASVQSRQSSAPCERDSLSHSTSSGGGAGIDPPVDDMLRQAELLCQKMRSSRQQAIASAVVADNPDDSIDDILRTAELLSLKMKGAETPPIDRHKTTATEISTPALIRQSDRILSKLKQNKKPSIDVTTPELMRQTEHLLGKMKASQKAEGSSENGSHSSGVLSNPDALVAKTKADQRAVSHRTSLLAQQNNAGEVDVKRSEELRHLMQEALSSWDGSPEEKGRVKDALEQIVPNLGSSPRTPSTVSIQPPDDISSVGSLSPRAHLPTAKTRSLLDTAERPPLPSNSHNVDTSDELAHKMAIALQEVLSGDSSDDEKGVKDENGACRDSTKDRQGKVTPSRHPAQAEPPSHSAKRYVVPPPPPPRYGLPLTENNAKGKSSPSRSSVSFTPSRRPISSEEAQYNAIMAAIDSSGSGPVSWERVDSAAADDDDYVPMVDYSKQGGTCSLGVGTFDIPVMGRSPRGRRRRRKVGRRMILACLALLGVGLLIRFWFTGGVHRGTATELPNVVTKVVELDDALYYDEPSSEPLVESAAEQSKVRWVSTDANAVALVPISPEPRIRAKVATVARRVQKLFIRFVLSLTPPWERFCSGDAQACRDTNYLLNSLGSC